MISRIADQRSCELVLPDGTTLPAGPLVPLAAWPDGHRLLLVLERPQPHLQHYLLGGGRPVQLAQAGEPPRPARIQLYVDLGPGDVCLLAVQPAPSVDPRIQSGG